MKSSHNPVVAYVKSAFEEFGKVTWPTKEQAALLTGIVIGVSLAVGVYLGLLDLGLSQGYQALLKMAPEATTTDSSATTETTTNSPGVTAPDGITVETLPADTTVPSTDSTSQQ
jgi:preprotein translocase SecE subunit